MRFAAPLYIVLTIVIAQGGPRSLWAQSPSAPEQQCAVAVQGKVAWDTAGNAQWEPTNLQRLCKGTIDPQVTIDCFTKNIQAGRGWPLAIKACAATPVSQATPSAAGPTAGSPTLLVDPACLAPVPWMVNPREVDIMLKGCRPASALPAPDSDGWRQFKGTDGGSISTRAETRDQASGAISFQVLVNGGGSGDFGFRVSGVPTASNVLKAGTFAVESLSPGESVVAAPAPAPTVAGVDPACLFPVPWVVNPADVDITLNGCRPGEALPAADANGWRHYDGPSGGFVEVRVGRDDAEGVDLEVAYNGGGSSTFMSRVQGVPDANGVLKAGTFRVLSGQANAAPPEVAPVAVAPVAVAPSASAISAEPAGRSVTLRNQSGFVAQLQVLYQDYVIDVGLATKRLNSEQIPAGSSATVAVPVTPRNQPVIVRLLIVGPPGRQFFRGQLDGGFSGEQCFQASGTVSSPQGGACP